MRKQNLQKELSPSILSRKISSFGKAMTGTSYPKNRLNERIITAPGHKT